MSELDSSMEIERAPAVLDFVRAYYAGALLAARHRPDDPHTQQRAADAWKEYEETARRLGLSSALAPEQN